jgi:hypothetical protein
MMLLIPMAGDDALERELREMLRLQASVNSKINPDWLTADNAYLRAVVVESVEAMDHHGWKWWSRQPLNMSQIQLELIDIWHFVLSDVLVKQSGDLGHAGVVIVSQWDSSADPQDDVTTIQLPALSRAPARCGPHVRFAVSRLRWQECPQSLPPGPWLQAGHVRQNLGRTRG